MMRRLSFIGYVLALHAGAQQPFALDTDFRTQIDRSNVNAILELPDGSLLLSGRVWFPGDDSQRLMAKVTADGTAVPSFPRYVGGGAMTLWNDRIYVRSGNIVRRILMDGNLDTGFMPMNEGPYFVSGQGGAYHVFPDGSLVFTGFHNLYDTLHGFVGTHSLVWFTNTGELDTTRVHRAGNGSLSELVRLPDGKFLVSGNCSIYDGQPTGRVLRLHPDGSLDTSFQTDVFWGRIYTFVPLADGRVYAGGLFQMVGLPGYVSLVRLMPDGSLDPTFNNDPEMELGELTGLAPMVIQILPLPTGELMVVGSFRTVDGHPRNSICMLDSTGQVMETFESAGCGSFTLDGFTYGGFSGITRTVENKYYLHGAYHGYSDGTTNDPLQRMVTRLHGGDLGTALPSEKSAHHVRAYPNPASTYLVVEHALAHAPNNARVELRDALGRPMLSAAVTQAEGQVVLDLRGLAAGAYTTVVLSGGALIHSKVVMVQ